MYQDFDAGVYVVLARSALANRFSPSVKNPSLIGEQSHRDRSSVPLEIENQSENPDAKDYLPDVEDIR
jgi:hypothetical protein